MAVVIGTVLFTLVEFGFMTFLLKYSFTEFANHNIAMLPCFTLIVFMIWIGNRVNRMAEVNTKVEDSDNGED